MAVFRKAPAEARRPNLTASAAQYTFGGAQTWQTMPEGDRRWQAEAWYQYDINGELRYATGWKGNACSQALLYAADVDPFTGKPTGPTDNKIVQTVTDSILGGPVRRPQHIRTIAVNLDVVGEVYIVVAAGTGGDADEWLVVSSTEFSKQGKTVQYSDPKTGTERTLSGNDMLIRTTCPPTSNPAFGLYRVHGVAMLEGLTWEDAPVEKLGCYLRRCSVTLGVSDPCLYSCGELCADEETLPLIDDCVPIGLWMGCGLTCEDLAPYRLTCPVPATARGQTSPVITILNESTAASPPLRIYGMSDPLGVGPDPCVLPKCQDIRTQRIPPGGTLIVDAFTAAGAEIHNPAFLH